MTMRRDTLFSGELAARAGVNVQTLRYYERRGLLRVPTRRASGYREYPRDAVRLIRFIKRAQRLGFTLREIAGLQRLRDGETAGTCAQVRTTAEAKIADIEQRIRILRAMERAFRLLVRSCRREGAIRECPLLEALEGQKEIRT